MCGCGPPAPDLEPNRYKSWPRQRPTCDGSKPAVVALLLLGGSLGRWDDLEALVGDRLAALDGHPEGSGGESSLGPLHGLELTSELLGQALVELVGVEVAR